MKHKKVEPTMLAHHPSDLTVAWAQQIVDKHASDTVVKNIEVVAVDIGTTTRVSLVVDHNSPNILPTRWFVKLPSLKWRARIITALPRLLHTEVRFYNEVAQSVPLELPACLAAQSRPFMGSTLVLADVAEFNGIPGSPNDTLTPSQATVVVGQLALIHARFWDKLLHDANYRWLAGPIRALEDFLGSALAVPLMKRGLQLAGNTVPAALHEPALHYARHRRPAMRFLADAPPTLIHHDCHPGNLFWNGSKSKVGFLDWQLVRIGEGISDIAYFLSTALSTESRQQHDVSLVAHYARILAEQGVENIDANQLMQRYRAHLVYAFEAMIVTLAVGGMMDLPSNLELIRRTASAVEEHDAFSALQI